MADRDSKQNMIESETLNIEIRRHRTQSDEFAVYVKCLQKSRQQIKYAMEKWALDINEKRTARYIHNNEIDLTSIKHVRKNMISK